MHNKWKLAVAVVAVTNMAWTGQALGQDEPPTVAPVELFACTFKEGKGMEDMAKLNEKFKKWSKKQDDGYSAWTITPQFRTNDGQFDVGWIGSWQAGSAMGKGLDTWMKGNDGLGAAYAELIDCSHSLVSSVAINAPAGPPNDGVVWFSSCSMNEGVNSRQAFEAHKKFSAGMRQLGGKGQSWLMYPALGFKDLDFDYYSVVSFNNYAELGEAWHLWTNGGGYEKHGPGLMSVVTCDSPRVYDARLVVGNER